MFVKGQSAVETDSQDFHVGGYWNCGASHVDVGERGECECPLSGSKDDGVRLIWIGGETVETEPGMEVGEALFKQLDMECQVEAAYGYV